MQGNKLYVGNLSYSVTTKDLEDLFADYGEIKDIKLIESKGFGFVELSSQAEAEKAKDALDGTEFKGRSIRVDEARPPKNREIGGYRRY